jgi:2-phosphosulfolactate phosphatase
MENWHRQEGFSVRCEWGAAGIEALLAGSDVVIIVDVLSFLTSVCVAVERGASVFPFRFADEARAAAFAKEKNAVLASKRGAPGALSLSPASLARLPEGSRLVLPSPNGATLSLMTGDTPTLVGCLRNARAVADAAQKIGKQVSVVPAGERWPDGSLRLALEDLVGAGAILSALSGARSPEAELAVAAFERFGVDLSLSVSGQELIRRGFEDDVAIACQIDASDCVPALRFGAYVSAR